MHRPIAVAVVLVAVSGTQARAQLQTSEASRWSVQPSVGVFLDAYDMRADGSRTGALFGLEVSRRFTGSPHGVTGALRGVASLAHARVDDVGTRPQAAPAYLVYRNEWTFATLGAAAELPVRRAALSLSLQGGFAWRRTPDVRLVGTPTVPAEEDPFGPPSWLTPGSRERSLTGVLVPGAAVRFPVARRLAVVGDARAYWTSFDEGGEVSPAFTVGLSWMP